MARDSAAAFTLETKELILTRAEFRCDRCGTRADNNGQFHHRTPRRAGGTRRTDLGLPSNGLLLHPSCHEFVESKRKIAAQLGFLVGYGSLPADVPIMLWKGWHLLTDAGGLVPLPGPPPPYPSGPETPDD